MAIRCSTSHSVIIYMKCGMPLKQSNEHVEHWCASRGLLRGTVVPLAQCWELAKRWDVNRLRLDWRGKTVAEIERIFEQMQLRDPFWSVR
jgi:hypothetical protein